MFVINKLELIGRFFSLRICEWQKENKRRIIWRGKKEKGTRLVHRYGVAPASSSVSVCIDHLSRWVRRWQPGSRGKGGYYAKTASYHQDDGNDDDDLFMAVCCVSFFFFFHIDSQEKGKWRKKKKRTFFSSSYWAVESERLAEVSPTRQNCTEHIYKP